MPAREAVGVGLGLLVIVVAYAWSGHFWIDLVDEGYFLDLSQRVLQGQLPYRDFTTYYTPGIFYLFALAFKLFGTNLLTIRYVMAALRALCALLLYGLTRRVAPGPIAWLPFGVIAALDHWPIEPEPHPSWPAIVACLLTLELVVRHLSTGRIRWLAAAGGAAGLAFLFKQNVGAFTALGVVGYALLRPRTETGAVLRAAQIAFVVGTALLVTRLMWSNLDVLTIGALWLPLLATLGVLMYRAVRAPAVATCGVVRDVTAASAGFGVMTLGWLVPLALALGPGNTPLRLFLGDLDQASIAEPFAPFTRGAQAVLLIAIWIPALLARSRRGWLYAAAASLVVLVLPVSDEARPELTGDPQLLPLLSWLDGNFGTLHLYLPSLAAWAGIGTLLVLRTDKGPYPWYVLFGTLAALGMYPRVDTLHSIVSSPPVLVAGAGAVAVLCGRLKDGVRPANLSAEAPAWPRRHSSRLPWRKLGVFAALVSVPVVALAPQLVWRIATVVSPDASAQRLDYAALQLERAPFLAPRQMAEAVRGAVTYVQAGTPPAEPFFAYPVAPLFNFLADRPNPTRFDHYLPGTLSAADFADVVRTLERTRPRYVLWDHLGVQRWDTAQANAALDDYIWRCYRQVAAFRFYLVLERDSAAC